MIRWVVREGDRVWENWKGEDEDVGLGDGCVVERGREWVKRRRGMYLHEGSGNFFYMGNH